jgi:hypothetical protein
MKLARVRKIFNTLAKIFIKKGKNTMNSKIFALIIKNLELAFNLPKYQEIRETLGKDIVVSTLPWTPARLEKFKEAISTELDLPVLKLDDTLESIVNDLDAKYLDRFFGQIWKPSTDEFQYSGWALVEEINRQNPRAVLDFGCGYNQFKGRIKNLVGIDPYNNCADYMVDILEFKVEPESYDHILVLGSLNFNDEANIRIRFERLLSLLMSGGRMYFRANPGIPHKTGPYVDIFPWSFEFAYQLASEYNLELETFKKDSKDRLYFVYKKN